MCQYLGIAFFTFCVCVREENIRVRSLQIVRIRIQTSNFSCVWQNVIRRVYYKYIYIIRLYWNNVIITVGAFCLEKKNNNNNESDWKRKKALYYTYYITCINTCTISRGAQCDALRKHNFTDQIWIQCIRHIIVPGAYSPTSKTKRLVWGWCLG